MAMKLATAYVDITAKDAGFKKGIQDMRSEVESNTKGLASLLGQMGAGAGIATGLGAALKIASTAEQSAMAFNVMIKDLDKTKQLLADLNTFSIVTPFEPAEVRRAAQSLLAFKTSVEEIPGTLQFLGDIAAGSGADLQEIVMVFNKIKAAGKLTGETFLQLAERSVNMQDILTAQLGISAEQFKKMQSEGKITFDMVVKGMQSMSAEGGMFFDAMNKQSTTASGMWSTLTGNVTALAEVVGGAMLPAFKFVIANLIRMQDIMTALDASTGGMVTQLIVATSVLALFTTSLLAARTAAQMLGLTVAKALMITGIGAVIPILGLIATLVYRVVKAIATSDTVMAAWSENVAKFGVAWERVKQAALNAWEGIKTAVMTAVTSIAEFFGIELSTMQGSTETFAAGAIQAIADWVLNTAEWLQVFSENWGTTWEIVKNTVAIALLFVRDLFTVNLTSIIGYAMGRQLRLFVDFWSAVISIAYKSIVGIGQILGKVFTNVWEGIKNLFAGKGFGDVMRGALDTIVKEASDFGEAFASGWNKENPFKLLESSEGMKKALAEQEKLFGKLADRKAELERESAALMAPDGTAGPGTPKPPPKEPTIAVKEIKFESGFFGFDQITKSIQEQVLKGETAQDKLVKQGDAAAIAMDEQTALLKSIDEKAGTTTGATASN